MCEIFCKNIDEIKLIVDIQLSMIEQDKSLNAGTGTTMKSKHCSTGLARICQ